MTIEIEIRNRDKRRQIEVIPIDFDKDTKREIRGAVRVVEPGLNCIVAIHGLRDLIIRERRP